MNMKQFQDTLRAIRRAGTPLVCVRTADPAAAIEQVCKSLNGKASATPMLAYDFMKGLVPLNEAGKMALAKARGNVSGDILATDDMLACIERLPGQDEKNPGPGPIVFFHNAHRVFGERVPVQGIWNLRDAFKQDGRALYLLTTRGAELPAELSSDVMVVDQPLPSVSELADIATGVCEANELPALDATSMTRTTDALIGLAGFPAEQVFSMSVTDGGLDYDRLWERKRQTIGQTPGLSVVDHDNTFDGIGGCQSAKDFLRMALTGRRKARVIVWIDEIEKQMSGSGPDSGSNVKGEMVGTLLTHMQERRARGALFLGPPGAAKSELAKSAGKTFGIPCIALDFSGLQNQFVGASGERLRACLAVIDAISDGEAYWIGTCNSMHTLSPELRRRFKDGTFFFDLPSTEERRSIWQIYTDKFGVDGFAGIDDTGWTGAEIRECCEKAFNFECTMVQASRYIVPVAVSAKDQIEALRQSATGKYLSASYPGLYSAQQIEVKPQAARRLIAK